MRNIITGGAGFIGSHLIDFLIKRDEQVVCIDNLSTGNQKNIAHWIDSPNFEFLHHDVVNPIKIKANRIWHLACPASIKEYQKNPIQTSKTNFLGTLNMLQLAKELNAVFLLTSSSEVYGNPKEHPQNESYLGNVNPIGIRSCYDEGKRIAESLCFDFARLHKVDVKVARIFNTYGPRMLPKDGRVISNFIYQALQKDPFTIYGEGLQTRSFCYILDLIDGLDKLMNSKFNGPFNFGNPEEYSIICIANKINDKVKNKFKYIKYPLPENDPSKRKPDITLAKKLLNWSPKIKLSKGLDITIDYFKNNY